MTVVFDFDYTLFATEKLKNAFRKAFRDLGASDGQFYESYHRSIDKRNGIYDFHPDRQAEAASIMLGISKAKLKKKLRVAMKGLNRFVYPGAKNLLSGLKKKGCTLILVSRANVAFNRQKIRNSGLDKYFDRIIIAPGKKHLYIKKALQKEKDRVVFINDNLNEIDELKKTLPKAEYVWKKSDYGRIKMGDVKKYNKKAGVKGFATLNEINNFFKNDPDSDIGSRRGQADGFQPS